jgi:release factor glutamine methyltransferase
MGLPFLVDRRALIPRQDTETLVEAALMLARERGYKAALDLCCGGGCIGVSLSKLVGLDVLAVDLSTGALQLAAENAAENGVAMRFQQSDLFRDIREDFDLIVCNPPYLSKADMASMQKELSFEPRDALYGGVDGLDFYRRIAGDYRPFLRRGGAMLLEIGALQADAVTAMFYGARVLNDTSGQPRVVIVDGP